MNLETIKFLFVGGINTIFTTIVFIVALYLLQFHYLLALTISWVLGNILTYILNFSWVFKPEKQLRFQERYVKYFVSNGISFLLNLITLHYLTIKTGYDPFFIQLGLMPAIVIVNFLSAKFWSMRRKYQQHSSL